MLLAAEVDQVIRTVLYGFAYADNACAVDGDLLIPNMSYATVIKLDISTVSAVIRERYSTLCQCKAGMIP